MTTIERLDALIRSRQEQTITQDAFRVSFLTWLGDVLDQSEEEMSKSLHYVADRLTDYWE